MTVRIATRDNPIVIRSFPGEHAVLDGATIGEFRAVPNESWRTRRQRRVPVPRDVGAQREHRRAGPRIVPRARPLRAADQLLADPGPAGGQPMRCTPRCRRWRPSPGARPPPAAPYPGSKGRRTSTFSIGTDGVISTGAAAWSPRQRRSAAGRRDADAHRDAVGYRAGRDGHLCRAGRSPVPGRPSSRSRRPRTRPARLAGRIPTPPSCSRQPARPATAPWTPASAHPTCPCAVRPRQARRDLIRRATPVLRTSGSLVVASGRVRGGAAPPRR
jgi:hypothetical protein